jgi:hypothetical protein
VERDPVEKNPVEGNLEPEKKARLRESSARSKQEE